MREASEPRTWWETMPATVVVVIATGVVAVTVAFLQLAMNDFGHGLSLAGRARHNLGFLSAWLVIPVLLTLALRDVRGRLTGREAVRAAVAVGAALALIVPALADLYLAYVDQLGPANAATYYRWSPRLELFGWLTLATALATIAGARGRRGAIAGTALVVLTVFAFPTPLILEPLTVEGSSTAARAWNPVFFTVVRLGYFAALAATLGTIVRSTAPPAPSMEATARGLEQTGSALIGQVMIAVGTAALTLMAFGAKSPGLMKVVVTIVPIALVIVTAIQVSGTFSAARGQLAPRRLIAAGALTLWVATAQAMRSIAAFRIARASWDGERSLDVFDRERLAAAAAALPYLTPTLAVGAMLLLLSATSAIRRHRRLDDGAVVGAAVGFVVATAVSLALQHGMLAKVPSVGEFLVLTVVIAVANVVALLTIARLCHKTGWALRLEPEIELPAARALS
ncbi:MAG: hypothetical protein KBG48_11225 [Kofleriaceae bacterium]|nr:hypothetical protein [Kofleriaceae bacterium]MBP9167955.1 hypothetical protein [Kofleriaceae bacterium]MBP9856789.1 hypothetical protein [Kofleriaceae bacterium]